MANSPFSSEVLAGSRQSDGWTLVLYWIIWASVRHGNDNWADKTKNKIRMDFKNILNSDHRNTHFTFDYDPNSLDFR
jgi:hypothetical protein